MRIVSLHILIGILLVSVTACVTNTPLNATEQPDPVLTPTPVVDSPPGVVDLEAFSPGDLLVQQDFEPGFFRPEAYYEFGRVPPFTLFADGTLIYILEGETFDQETVMPLR